jgi:hypothetical protein
MNQAYSINEHVLSFRVLQHYTNVVQTSNVESAANAVPLLHPTRITEGD